MPKNPSSVSSLVNPRHPFPAVPPVFRSVPSSSSRAPSSRHSTFDDIDTVPFAYAAGGIQRVIEQAKNDTPLDALEEYGGGDLSPLLYTPFAENGNYLEPNSIANRHSVCGGPRLVSERLSRCYD